MGNQPPLFSLLPLPPLVPDDIDYNPFALEIPKDVLELQADALNVLENIVPLDSFSPERQNKIKNYYRFSAILQTTRSHNIAQRIAETMEIV